MRVEIVDGPMDAGEIVAGMKAGGDGAVCVFDGFVRDNTRGRKTLYLDYEAYREMALEHNVPIMENPPLARALYDKVELASPVPPKSR